MNRHRVHDPRVWRQKAKDKMRTTADRRRRTRRRRTRTRERRRCTNIVLRTRICNLGADYENKKRRRRKHVVTRKLGQLTKPIKAAVRGA